MKKKIIRLITQKMEAKESLNKEYEYQAKTKLLCEGYSTKMDKFETEIDLLQLLLKD